MSAGVPARSEADLTEAERAELKDAHAELRAAAAAYGKYSAPPLKAGQDIVPIPMDELAAAQSRVDQAEAKLWSVRERLLGWHRPSWAPSATQVADWLSDEDAVYDSLDGPWAE